MSTQKLASPMPIIIFAATGLVVFALTGFLGYCPPLWEGGCAALPGDRGLLGWLDYLFLKPWLLFLWLCALAFALERAMLAAEPDRALRRVIYTVTVIGVILVGVLDLWGPEVRDAINTFLQWLGHGGLLFQLVSSAWFYTLVNVGIILALAISAGNRWMRLSRVRKLLGLEGAQKQDDPLPQLHELVIGDILVRSAIVLALSVVLRAEVIGALAPRPAPDRGLPVFTPQSVALPYPGAPTLSFLDLILALFGFVAGVSLAALFAQGEVEARDEGLPPGATATFARLGNGVANALLDMLVRPFESIDAEEGKWLPARHYDPLGIVRIIGGWLLIFVGMVGIGTVARAIRQTLHHAADLTGLPGVFGVLPDGLIYEAMAIAAGAVALGGILVGAWVITRNPLVLRSGADLLKRTGFITLLLVCAYALALWLTQTSLLQFFPTQLRLTAFDLGPLTIVSFTLLLGFGIPEALRRVRERV